MKGRWALVAPLVMLGACGGTRLVPVPSSPADEIVPGRRAITKRVANLRVTVEAVTWRHRPRRLTEHVLPLLVEAENQGRETVRLLTSEIGLVDGLGRIHRVLSPQEVLSRLTGGSDASAAITSIGIEATGPEPLIFGLELGLSMGSGRDLRDVWQLAFPPDPLPPGSRAEGFIYFPRVQSGVGPLTVFVALDAPLARHELQFVFALPR